MEDACPRRPGEEVDIDAGHPVGTELDVARARPSNGPGGSLPCSLAMREEATTRAAPSAKTPAFGTPIVATSPTAYTPGNRDSSVVELTGT